MTRLPILTMQQQIDNGQFHMKRSYTDYRTLFSPVIDIELPDSGFILDSGCGMGYACRELEQRDPDNLCVIGITITRTPTVHPVIYYNLENSLLSRLKYNINLCIDVYGAISYSCYPVKAINNILEVLNVNGKIYIFCTFLGRLNDINSLLHNIHGLTIDYVDDSRMVIVKTTHDVIIDKHVQEHEFYPGNMAVVEPKPGN